MPRPAKKGRGRRWWEKTFPAAAKVADRVAYDLYQRIAEAVYEDEILGQVGDEAVLHTILHTARELYPFRNEIPENPHPDPTIKLAIDEIYRNKTKPWVLAAIEAEPEFAKVKGHKDGFLMYFASEISRHIAARPAVADAFMDRICSRVPDDDSSSQDEEVGSTGGTDEDR